ncbi:MAG: YfiM family protein [Melioribacteraceae bacterium]|nr:YfiM family protein [Melioribacteraceae bacterium]
MNKTILNKIIILLVLIIFSGSNIFAQSDSLISSPKYKSLNHLRELQYTQQISDFNPLHKEINYSILGGVSLGYAYIIYQINDYYQNTWWKEDSNYYYDGSFHVVTDNSYALGLDKLGHAYGTAVISHFFSSGLQAANVNHELSIWLGALGGLSMQLYVEIQDGFAPKDIDTGKPRWGFSPGDAISNVLGATYFVGRYYYPYLNNFQLRVSYYPSEAMRKGEKPDNNISDDYDGQKLWLAFRMKNLLPTDLAKYWPSFLMLSAGYGVTGIGDNATDAGLQQSYYLAFDIDAEEIPLYGEFWSFIKNTLNYIHFPMPGLKFSNDGVQFLLIAY